jgi:hypothetical protein
MRIVLYFQILNKFSERKRMLCLARYGLTTTTTACGRLARGGARLFRLKASACAMPQQQSVASAAAFSQEILNAFSDRTAPVMDLTFGDGLHSKLLLGTSPILYRNY